MVLFIPYNIQNWDGAQISVTPTALPPASFTYYKPYDVIHVRTKYILGTIGLDHIDIQLESTKDIQQSIIGQKRTTQT